MLYSAILVGRVTLGGGRGDKVHRDWIYSKGLKYSELLLLQIKSFGGEGFKKLASVLEKETKVKD